jgi:hypothetical protein
MFEPTRPYEPLTSENAAVVLIDHQVGLMTGVRDYSTGELKHNVVALAKAAKALKLPIIVTTTARDSMWGPTFPELVEALPGIPIIDRSSVNAFDDTNVAQAIVATGGALASAPLCLIRHVGWNKIPSGVSREASVRLLRALKSGDQGRVQCDSHGTFDTRGTVRTRRSRSIKRTQGPAADRAASQQGVRRTTHAQQSTRGICPHSHREESSRQQVDKDRRTAEQRDELAPSYVERGLLPTSGPRRQQ